MWKERIFVKNRAFSHGGRSSVSLSPALQGRQAVIPFYRLGNQGESDFRALNHLIRLENRPCFINSILPSTADGTRKGANSSRYYSTIFTVAVTNYHKAYHCRLPGGGTPAPTRLSPGGRVPPPVVSGFQCSGRSSLAPLSPCCISPSCFSPCVFEV